MSQRGRKRQACEADGIELVVRDLRTRSRSVKMTSGVAVRFAVLAESSPVAASDAAEATGGSHRRQRRGRMLRRSAILVHGDLRL